jgi:hypothetical protein
MARRIAAAIVVLVFVHLFVKPGAPARGTSDVDDNEARVETRCSRGSEGELRLRIRGREIRVEVDIEVEQAGGPWRVILLHERRTAFRATLRPGSSGRIRLRRTVPNWFGTDAFTLRAAATRGEVCRASAVV